MSVLKINRNQFIHVKDKNTNAVRLVIGPKTFTTEEYEEVVKAPTKMILVPPEHFVVITNPVVKDENENIVYHFCVSVCRHSSLRSTKKSPNNLK
jgi:hypothetical protein